MNGVKSEYVRNLAEIIFVKTNELFCFFDFQYVKIGNRAIAGKISEKIFKL